MSEFFKRQIEWAALILAAVLITLVGWWHYVLGFLGVVAIVAIILAASYNSNELRRRTNNNQPRKFR